MDNGLVCLFSNLLYWRMALKELSNLKKHNQLARLPNTLNVMTGSRVQQHGFCLIIATFDSFGPIIVTFTPSVHKLLLYDSFCPIIL